MQSLDNIMKPSDSKRLTYPLGLLMIIIGFAVFSISGCNHCRDIFGNYTCDTYTYNAPVYMSYEELRTTAIHTEINKSLTKTGKIYIYQNYLLVNTPNQGIHIYDNTDKENPVSLVFVNIPGNLDIAVKQDNLYVDSYIDLVVLDISNMNNIQEIHRIENVFPYNAYQNIPEDIFLEHVDESKGVVIDYEERERRTNDY